MNEAFTVRPTTLADLPALLRLYEESRAFMRANGNGEQWGTEWPPADWVERDIRDGLSYVVCKGNSIHCVFAYIPGDDPTYAQIDGPGWIAPGPYGVVHRIASGGGRTGAGTVALEWAFAQCGNLRIDTHEKNRPMRGLLQKLGFTYCGTVVCYSGTVRLAYQKVR